MNDKQLFMRNAHRLFDNAQMILADNNLGGVVCHGLDTLPELSADYSVGMMLQLWTSVPGAVVIDDNRERMLLYKFGTLFLHSDRGVGYFVNSHGDSVARIIDNYRAMRQAFILIRHKFLHIGSPCTGTLSLRRLLIISAQEAMYRSFKKSQYTRCIHKKQGYVLPLEHILEYHDKQSCNLLRENAFRESTAIVLRGHYLTIRSG